MSCDIPHISRNALGQQFKKQPCTYKHGIVSYSAVLCQGSSRLFLDLTRAFMLLRALLMPLLRGSDSSGGLLGTWWPDRWPKDAVADAAMTRPPPCSHDHMI